MSRRRRAMASELKTFHFDFEGSKFNLGILESAHPSVPRNHRLSYSEATPHPPTAPHWTDGVRGGGSETEEEKSAQNRGAKIITMMKLESPPGIL